MERTNGPGVLIIQKKNQLFEILLTVQTKKIDIELFAKFILMDYSKPLHKWQIMSNCSNFWYMINILTSQYYLVGPVTAH